jgi:hypothetical protein
MFLKNACLTGQMLARYAPALLLCVVALTQINHVFTNRTSPWKRGGFGMFSTTDWRGGRELTIKVTDANETTTPILLRYSLSSGKGERSGYMNTSLGWYLNTATMRSLLTGYYPSALRRFGELILSEGEFTQLNQAEKGRINDFALYRKGDSAGIQIIGAEKADPERFVKVRVRSDLEPKTPGKPTALQPKLSALPLAASKVELQLWRNRFDPRSGELHWVPVGKSIVVLRNEKSQ